MKNRVFLNSQVSLSASGMIEDLFADYKNAVRPLHSVTWSTEDESRTRWMGLISDRYLGTLSDPWDSNFRSRMYLGVEIVLKDLFRRTSDRNFDAVLVGHGGTRGFNPRAFAPIDVKGRLHDLKESLVDIFKREKVGVPSTESIFFVESSCVTGVTQLSMAEKMIRIGRWSRVLLLGFDPISVLGFGHLEALGVIAERTPPEGPRVFSSDRDGFLRAEAICAAVLSNQHELETVSPIEVLASSLSCDANGLTAIDSTGAGLQHCIEFCLRLAGVQASEVAFVKAHGTGTKMNDRVESEVLHEVFKESLRSCPTVSFKSQFGHSTNASGLFELGLAVHCLRRESLMPVLGSSNRDETLSLMVPQEVFKLSSSGICLGLAMGFGGFNGVYILRKGGNQ